MSLSIFFCYAHEDEDLLKKLKAHLRLLQRQGLATVWYDRDISAGTEWEQQINEQLNSAQIILLFAFTIYPREVLAMSHDAFLSYAHNDDEGEGGISALRLALERFLGAHLGRSATIYQDKNGLRAGQVWHDELESALRCPCLVPVVTPGYLNSDYCVKELIDFADLEAGKQQIDRIVPLYYIEVGAIEQRLGRPSQLVDQYNGEKQKRAIDILTQRQMEDIRWFRTSSPSEIISVREARAVLDRVARELATRTLSARRTAPTLVVDREGAGLHSISAAIRRAEPGARILVKGPAEYRESLIIDKPLEIIGEGKVTLVGIGGAAIACTGAPVRIAKLNVTAKGFNGVIISGGYCVLQELEISGTRYSAVLIRDGAESLIIGCSLHHAEHSGVHAQLDSKCTVVNSTIRENGAGGLFYSQGAEGLAEGNLIERNKYNGIYIAARANPRIRRNRIRHHPYAGILVYRQGDMWDYGPGRGIIEDNDITDGDQFGIEIKDRADPCVRRNTIKANAWGGIWTHEGGCGTIYDNQILENRGAGIKNEGGHPRIGRNVFSGNGGKPVEDHGGAIFDEQASCGD